MSLHRRNPRRDGNEKDIVDTLEARGFHVDRVSAPGFPDLVVSKQGRCWLVEVKQPKGRFRASQIEWRAKFQGPPPICLRSVEQALSFPEVQA